MMKQSKVYRRVVWTRNEGLRAERSLIEWMVRPYRRLIERLEAENPTGVSGLLEVSRAYERLADLYLSLDCTLEAFRALCMAAEACTWCDDIHWLQGESCEFPTLPLLRRFRAMHARVLELISREPRLSGLYHGSRLEHELLFFTRDSRREWREFCEAYDRIRAWRFGRC